MTASDPVDVVDVLTTDHHEILELIEQIGSDLPNAETRRDVADTVTAELIRHSVAEEMYVYPAIRDHLPNGHDIVDGDIEEHQELEEALHAWEGVAGDDPDFEAHRERVEQLLRHHATDEETAQFPLLREHVPSERLQEMARQVETAKRIAPTRPHPGSPHSELFHKLMGPGVGLADKFRDALSGRSRNT